MSDHVHITHTLTEEELFCLEGCSSYKQYWHMRSSFEKQECAFCTVDPSLNTVLFENSEWFVFENAFKNDRACSTMLVIASQKHIRTLKDMTPYFWTQFAEMIEWIGNHYDLPGGMLFVRFGDMRLTGQYHIFTGTFGSQTKPPKFVSRSSRIRQIVTGTWHVPLGSRPATKRVKHLDLHASLTHDANARAPAHAFSNSTDLQRSQNST